MDLKSIEKNAQKNPKNNIISEVTKSINLYKYLFSLLKYDTPKD